MGGDGFFSGCVISATSSTAGAPAGSPAWPYAAWAAPIAPIILGGATPPHSPPPNPKPPPSLRLLCSHSRPTTTLTCPHDNYCGAKNVCALNCAYSVPCSVLQVCVAAQCLYFSIFDSILDAGEFVDSPGKVLCIWILSSQGKQHTDMH